MFELMFTSITALQDLDHERNRENLLLANKTIAETICKKYGELAFGTEELRQSGVGFDLAVAGKISIKTSNTAIG